MIFSLFFSIANKSRKVAPLLRVDIARRILVQKHLALLLHSRQCVYMKTVASIFNKAHVCHIAECEYMDEIQKHCYSCLNDSCTIPLCGTTKVVMAHWRRCKKRSCQFCGPVTEIAPSLNVLAEIMNQLSKHCWVPENYY